MPTVVELKAMCKRKRIKGYSKLKKAELMRVCAGASPKRASPKRASPKRKGARGVSAAALKEAARDFMKHSDKYEMDGSAKRRVESMMKKVIDADVSKMSVQKLDTLSRVAYDDVDRILFTAGLARQYGISKGMVTKYQKALEKMEKKISAGQGLGRLGPIHPAVLAMSP